MINELEKKTMSQELIKLPTKEFKVEARISHESALQTTLWLFYN